MSDMVRTAVSDHQLQKTHIENIKKICNFFWTNKATAASPAVDTHQSSISGSTQ